MFGFSIFKLLFTIAIVFVVWNGFKYFTRVQQQREKNMRVKSRNKRPNSASAHDDVEDMVECKVCAAYVTRGAKPCGRDDCPFTG